MNTALLPTRSPVLAQLAPWEDQAQNPAVPAPAPAKPMSFSDLQHGMRAYQSGETNDNTFRNGSLILIVVIAIVALLLHLRQRKQEGGPPDSVGRLNRELGRCVAFPFASRLMLWWVARDNNVPFASLLLSSALFDRCINAWSRRPSLGSIRQWGLSRLAPLRAELFPDSAACALPVGK